MPDHCNPATCGCHAEIKNLKSSDKDLWEKMDKLNEKIDSINGTILTRINVVLGGIAVACILLAINLALGK